MHSRTVEQVRSWDSRPFSGGLDALSTLSDDGHTGAVVADDTWLFMLNGRVIGIFEGAIEDFSASGTVYSTPHDGLPLLFAMQEREGRTRAKYFTEDTALSEADQTLADANFTGYIELSENVLSGDYYLVYYGGTRRSVAFVGQSERVETAEDAFELAAEEVGLYEVKDVSMTITEIPNATAGGEPTSDEAEPAVAATPASADPIAEDSGESTPTAEPEESSAERSESEREPEETSEKAVDAGDVESTEASPSGQSAEADGTRSTRGDPTISDAETPSEPHRQPETERSSSGLTASAPDPEPEAASPADSETEPAAATAPEGDQSEPEIDSETTDELERRFREEAEWRQTRAIPALAPDETAPTEPEDSKPKPTPSPDGDNPDTDVKQSQPTKAESSQKREHAVSERQSRTSRSDPPTNSHRSVPEHGGAGSRRENLEAAVSEREDRIESLEARLSEIESERSELETELAAEREKRSQLERELEDLREERDRLAERIETLEASGNAGTGSEGTIQMDPSEALAGTNLFVRYASKGKPTLEALGEEVERAAVNENLALEHHTQFETDAVQVDGQDFRTFLEGTGAFQFVSWVLRELPYELLETGKRSSMPELFDAISAVDRIELDGSVTVDPESGTAQTFTLVMRDRMGNPLIVGEYNEGRNPVTEDQLKSLLDGAKDVADASETLVGAFYVTASFFDPGSLELAENAASSGGLFSRQEKASYVTADSGSGFHLGLIEDRSQSFHVTVPKL